MGRMGRLIATALPSAAYFPRGFFPLDRHVRKKLGHGEQNGKGKTREPQAGSFQLELVPVGTDLPRLNCKSRRRSMAARTGWVPRWR